MQRDLRGGGIDLPEVVGGEFDGDRAKILLQMQKLRGARDGIDPRLLRQQPGQRDLGGRRSLALRPVAQHIDQRQVRLQRLGGQVGNAATVAPADGW